MAKVRQLINTFQPRQQSVLAPSINVNKLAPGLAQASSSFQAATQIKNDFNTQKSVAQGERASWEMEDWTNRFLQNMNSPEKLKAAFKSTPYESLASGINADFDIYDSSTAQNLYRQAIEVTGNGIDDENTRNLWMTAKMREWEKIEPTYQREADKWLQTDARNTELQNLNSLWKAGYGTESVEFRSKLDNMREMGHFGIDAVASFSSQQQLLLNYQKSEQTQVMEKMLYETLMPYAKRGASEEEINIVMNGLELSLNGVDYLTEDEKKKVTNKWLNHAKNYASLYEQKVAEGHQEWQDTEWQEIQYIVSGGDLEEGQRLAMAQQKVNQLIVSYDQELSAYDTGIKDMAIVPLGTPDSDELNKMVQYLNRYVSANGNDGPSKEVEIDALVAANNTIGDPGLSPSSKKMIMTQLFRDGRLSEAKYSEFFQKIDSFSTSLYTKGYSTANKVADSLEWDNTTRASLMSQLTSFYENAAGLNPGELEAGVNNLVNGFADDNTDVMGIVDTWQEESVLFWAGWQSNGRNPSIFVRKNFGNFQHRVEAGDMAGIVTHEPELFAEYTSFAGEQFSEGFYSGALDSIDTTGMVVNEKGEPQIVAWLVDPFGNAQIAVRVQSDYVQGDSASPTITEEQGLIQVRVFQPVNLEFKRDGERRYDVRKTELDFVELTDDSAYYVTTMDEFGNQVDPIEGDQLSIAQRGIMAFTGRYTAYGQPIMEEISIDPDFLMRNKNGSKPF